MPKTCPNAAVVSASHLVDIVVPNNDLVRVRYILFYVAEPPSLAITFACLQSSCFDVKERHVTNGLILPSTSVCYDDRLLRCPSVVSMRAAVATGQAVAEEVILSLILCLGERKERKERLLECRSCGFNDVVELRGRVVQKQGDVHTAIT